MQTKFIIAVLAAFASAKAPSFQDAAYLASTRQSKANLIWSQVIANTKTYGWYSAVATAGLFTESMDPTMTQVGD